MGLFRKKKKSPLVQFLDKADKVLLYVYETGDLRAFYAYCNPTFVGTLEDLYRRNRYKLFGVERYRVREWNITYENGPLLVVHKTMYHIPTKLTKSLVYTLGETIEETWYINKGSGQYKIEGVKEGHL